MLSLVLLRLQTEMKVNFNDVPFYLRQKYQPNFKGKVLAGYFSVKFYYADLKKRSYKII